MVKKKKKKKKNVKEQYREEKINTLLIISTGMPYHMSYLRYYYC